MSFILFNIFQGLQSSKNVCISLISSLPLNKNKQIVPKESFLWKKTYLYVLIKKLHLVVFSSPPPTPSRQLHPARLLKRSENRNLPVYTKPPSLGCIMDVLFIIF